jgi:hypothetical protein
MDYHPNMGAELITGNEIRVLFYLKRLLQQEPNNRFVTLHSLLEARRLDEEVARELSEREIKEFSKKLKYLWD